MKSGINLFKFIGAGIYFLLIVLSFFTDSLRQVFTNFSSIFTWFLDEIKNNPLTAVSQLQWWIAQLLIPIGALALGAMALLAKSKKLVLWSNLAWVFFVLPLTWITFAVWSSQNQISIPLEFAATPTNSSNRFVDWAILVLILASSAIAVVDYVLTKRAPVQPVEPVAQASYQPPVQTGAGNEQLPLIALICAFVFPVAGIIVGHIALSQINRGQINPQNKGMAMAATVVGYAFVALSIIMLIAFSAWLAVLSNSYRY